MKPVVSKHRDIMVKVEPLEYMFAAQAGFFRQASNVVRGRKDAYNFTGDGYGIHIQGAVGEFVVAKALGLFWAGPGKLRGHDIGVSYEVRAGTEDWHKLILHPEDKDDAVFILVTGNALDYAIRGWLIGRDGKKPAYWCEHVKGRPAFFVPQADLNNIHDLKLASPA